MEARHRAMLRACSGAERVAIISNMFDMMRRIAISSIRASSPGIGEGELRQRLFLRDYGDEFTPEQRERILAAIAAHWERTRDVPASTAVAPPS